MQCVVLLTRLSSQCSYSVAKSPSLLDELLKSKGDLGFNVCVTSWSVHCTEGDERRWGKMDHCTVWYDGLLVVRLTRTTNFENMEIMLTYPALQSITHGRRKRGGGDGGDASPAVEKSARDVPPEIMIFKYLFSSCICKFDIFNIFEIKWPKSEEKLNFGSRWVWVPMNTGCCR